MKRLLLGLTLMGMCGLISTAQTFTNQNSTLINNTSLSSGCVIAVCDMNNDGLDDLIRLDNASDLEIEYQTAGGGLFGYYDYGNVGPGTEWGLAIADVDGNGYKDIVVGGAYNDVKLLLANGTGTAYTSSNLPGPGIFVQSITFNDIDGDGDIDILSCHDDGISAAYENDGTGSFTYATPSLFDGSSTVPSDNSGNYGMCWTDYNNDGDADLYLSKCRLGVSDPFDGRRINMLFDNDGAGNYTDIGVAAGIVPYGQSWAADFSDFDNDGDLDAIVLNHDMVSNIYRNNNDGTFTDVTASSGVQSVLDNAYLGRSIQIKCEDFDNDMYTDMIITGRDGVYLYLHNDGPGLTFTDQTSGTFNGIGALDIHSCAVGDLNDDGYMDIATGYGTGYNSASGTDDRVYINDGGSNNWFKAVLTGTTSNINGLGARLELYGPWGMQIREVRSGESYGIMNSMIKHFGLSTFPTIDSLVVRWPSGTVDVVCAPPINTQISLTEGTSPGPCPTCTPPDAGTNGANTLCANDGTIHLFDELGGTPDTGGSWSGPSVLTGGDLGTFDPSTNAAGVYTYTVPGTAPCTDATADVTITINTVDNSTSLAGFTITAGSATGTYQWLDCNNGMAPLVGETNQDYTATMNGDYAVEVTDNGCVDTSACVNITGIGIVENGLGHDITVYPNPTDGQITIDLGIAQTDVELTVYDMNGRLVESTQISGQILNVDITNEPTGTYVIQLTVADKQATLHVVKE